MEYLCTTYQIKRFIDLKIGRQDILHDNEICFLFLKENFMETKELHQ